MLSPLGQQTQESRVLEILKTCYREKEKQECKTVSSAHSHDKLPPSLPFSRRFSNELLSWILYGDSAMCGYCVAGTTLTCTLWHIICPAAATCSARTFRTKQFPPLLLENEDFELDTVSSSFRLKTPFYKPISLKWLLLFFFQNFPCKSRTVGPTGK